MRLQIEELEARAVPSISASGTTITGTEGISFNGVVATFTDTDSGAPVNNFTTSIAWGDGTTSAGTVQATDTGFQVSGSHTYADEGAPSVAVTINDIDGSTATATSMAQIAENDALTATGYNLSGFEGQTVSGIVATFTDVTYPGNSPDDFAANISWGDNTTSAGIISSQGNLFVVRGSHTYAEEGFYYNIRVTISDDGGASAAAIPSSTANIADAPLTATGTPVTATEGLSFSGQIATVTDANPNATLDDFTQTYYWYPIVPFMPIGQNLPFSKVTIDWGDGTSAVLGNGQITQPGGVGTPFEVSGTHTYAEEGSYTIKATISDNGGSTVIATTTATVADAPLTATGTPVKAVEGVNFSGQVATFTDANPNASIDDFNWPPPGSGIEAHNVTLVTIDWGDGTSFSVGNGFIAQPGGVGTPFIVTSSHTYAKAGSYTISVSVNDETLYPVEGWSSTMTTSTATVTDPDDIVGRLGDNGQLWTGVSTGSSFVTSMWGAWNPAIAWVDVVKGDFNGDGLTDIAGRDMQTGDWYVALSTGSSYTTSVWTTWNPKATWVDVQVGDFTGDGKADIVGRVKETGQWWMAQSTGSSFANSLWDTWAPTETWVDVKVGDFNGDGKADITGRDLQTGAWWTGLSTGSSFATSLWALWNPNVTWVDVNVGDFNGDGKTDIVGRVLETGQWWVGLSNGSAFTASLWATWSTAVTWVDVHVGDFNGDGSTDIIGRALETGQWWVGLSNDRPLPPGVFLAVLPPAFTTTLWSTWSTAVTWVDVQVGDFNGDSKADITGRALESGQWWTGLSNGSGFNTSLWATWSTAVHWSDVHQGDFA